MQQRKDCDCKGLKDKILICVDCGEEFVFTISAQEYFLQRKITEDPQRCKSCYLKIKKNRRNGRKRNNRNNHSNHR